MGNYHRRSPTVAGLLNIVPGLGLGYAFNNPVLPLANFAVTVLFVQHHDYGLEALLLAAIINAALAFVLLAGARLQTGESLLPVTPADAVVPERKSPLLAGLMNFFVPGFGLAYALDSLWWGLLNLAAACGLLVCVSPMQAGWPLFILAGSNAGMAFVFAARRAGQHSAPPKHEKPSVFFAFVLNAVFPGLGVEYGLSTLRVAGLPAWEWGLINLSVSVGAIIGHASLTHLMLLNAMLGFAAAFHSQVQAQSSINQGEIVES